MTAQPPLNSPDDFRRLALNAGTYGMVMIPARALLDLVGENASVEDLPDARELRSMVSDAERAAGDAEDAASALYEAARDLQRVYDAMPKSPSLLADGAKS